MEQNKTYHKANAIQSGQAIKVILLATFISMGFMFLFIILEFPFFLTIALFLGIMFLSIFSFMYTGEYWINGQQLEEKLTPKLKFMPFLKPQHNFYTWGELDSYLEDSNMTRYSGEQRYLKLTFKNPRRVVSISEGNTVSSKETYAKLLNTFNSFLAEESTENPPSTQTTTSDTIVSETNSSNESTPQPKPIKAKAEKSFYEGIGGKILAILFLLLSIVLLLMYFVPQAFGGIEIKGSNSWKLWAIVIPGTLYMMKRAFFSSKK
jgi:F0F1-type ATP synthase assembly protein I